MGRKGNYQIQKNMCFQFEKGTHKTPVIEQENKEKVGKVRFVFSYRCKAPMTIRTQPEWSTLVATNNGSCMPKYVDQICENMCSPMNKQTIIWISNCCVGALIILNIDGPTVTTTISGGDDKQKLKLTIAFTRKFRPTWPNSVLLKARIMHRYIKYRFLYCTSRTDKIAPWTGEAQLYFAG